MGRDTNIVGGNLIEDAMLSEVFAYWILDCIDYLLGDVYENQVCTTLLALGYTTRCTK